MIDDKYSVAFVHTHPRPIERTFSPTIRDGTGKNGSDRGLLAHIFRGGAITPFETGDAVGVDRGTAGGGRVAADRNVTQRF